MGLPWVGDPRVDKVPTRWRDHCAGATGLVTRYRRDADLFAPTVIGGKLVVDDDLFRLR